VDLNKVPDTYIEPFVAYRVWGWTAQGLTSLFNDVVWTPKQAFEAKCQHANDLRRMQAACTTPEAKAFWEKQLHRAPDPSCTCGMYAGTNVQHLIALNYTQFGVHGEVSLWGRLYRHTLGWRAQYAYPRYLVVPAIWVPFKADDAQKRLAKLTEYDVDIYLQPEREARVGQERIPLWVRDYGYSQQGISFLIERWTKWDSHKITHTLAVGDRLAVLSDVNGGGIGVVKEIDGEEIYYTMFAPNMVYHKKLKDIVWNDHNWRWETTGLGMMRKLK
jgi:hypothetical protein